MKQLLTILVCAIVLTSCKTQQINAQFQPEGKKPYLVGKIDKTGLQDEVLGTWFNTNYDNYKPNADDIAALTEQLKDYDIMLFMGTWCGDSKREVPRFYKILEASNYPMKQLTTVALSREKGSYKESPQHEEAGLNIVRVPTFIFFKDGKEVNRIIEDPKETLEKDMLKIINGQAYQPNYFGAIRKPKVIKK